MRRIGVLVAGTCLCFAPGLWAAETEPAGTVLVGDKLDPADYGPGVIEDIDTVLAREQERLAKAAGQPQPREGERGVWSVPGRNATYFPYSGVHNLVNKWGDTCMAISFPHPVDVHGAYFAGQGGEDAWTPGLRAIGYRDGREVQTTDWFQDVGAGAVWFEVDLRDVDRIVIQARPGVDRRGWYALDDLTYTPVATPDDPEPQTAVVDFEDCHYKQTLSGTHYAGLTWESGPGDFDFGDAIHAPKVPPGFERPAPGESAAGPGLRAGTLPDLLQSFQGVVRGDAGQWSYPPDTCGAIGPNHFLEVVNTTIAAYNKTTGSRVWITGLSSFYPGSSGGDPRVLYDQHSGRWIVTWTNFSDRIYLCVSLTNNPTGSWFKTYFPVSQGSDAGRWPDYPTLGVDDAGVYTSAYMVGGGMSIFALDKAPLIAPSPSLGTVTAFRDLTWEGAIQPAHTYGDPNAEYFVSRSGSSSIRLRRLTGPLTAPTLTSVGLVSVPAWGYPPDAPALGSSPALDTVDDRLMNAVFRNDAVWTCHTVSVSGRAACRWYQIETVGTPSLVQSGTVNSASLYYFFPSIAVNARGDAVMAFSGSNSSQYAGTYYTGRLYNDPVGGMADPVQYKAGMAPQNNIDGYGRNRWGDYSLSTVDPSDNLTLWTIQEYGHATNIWGTYIARLSLYSDCNSNGVNDRDDISAGTSQDCNANNVPDECETDCNASGHPDNCDVTAGTSPDCNGNLTPDECESPTDCQPNGIQDFCDIAVGTSRDCNANAVPDECELAGHDCNANGTLDSCDIAGGSSYDCQDNGTPDECERDCNGNGIDDACDISAGTAEDCQLNGTPDSCDLLAGTSQDCTANGTPDECELDCNSNGVRDDCDITAATSRDCNTNGIPDECDATLCYNLWDGFQPNPPFSFQRPMSEIDYNADGIYWYNPSQTAVVFSPGCEDGSPFDQAVKVSVLTTNPESGYVESEYFRTQNGMLGGGARIYRLHFEPKLTGNLNPKVDWQFSLYDAVHTGKVIQIDFTSTVSTRVPAAQRGKILVRDPSGSDYLDTGVTVALSTCYDFEVVLDSGTGTVQLYINGTARLTPPLSPLTPGAVRMDYFRLQAVSNGSASAASTTFWLDRFELCLTGASQAPPSVWDCNGNGTLDECDLTSDPSLDCNVDGILDACQLYGDMDRDGDVDLTDYATFSGCLTGPGGGPIGPGCGYADFDCDDDIDLGDFARLQAVFTGP